MGRGEHESKKQVGWSPKPWVANSNGFRGYETGFLKIKKKKKFQEQNNIRTGTVVNPESMCPAPGHVY